MKKRIVIILLVMIFIIIIAYVSVSIYLSIKINNILNGLSDNGEILSEYNSIISEEAYDTITESIPPYNFDYPYESKLNYYKHTTPTVKFYGLGAKVTYSYSIGVTDFTEDGEVLQQGEDLDVELRLKLENFKWKIVDAYADNY